MSEFLTGVPKETYGMLFQPEDSANEYEVTSKGAIEMRTPNTGFCKFRGRSLVRLCPKEKVATIFKSYAKQCSLHGAFSSFPENLESTFMAFGNSAVKCRWTPIQTNFICRHRQELHCFIEVKQSIKQTFDLLKSHYLA